MTAYLIIEHKITDAAKFEEYRVRVRPMIAKHGGPILTKGGTHKLPEGGHWKPELVAIFEFPDIGLRLVSRTPRLGVIMELEECHGSQAIYA